MRVAYVTAGGAGMYCGSCMRDNTLVRTLRDQGCDVVLVPTFTPIRTDENDVSLDRVFLGGVSVYLDQRWPAYRRAPRVVRQFLDSPRILRAVSRLALQRRGAGDGALAISLLRGKQGHHGAEIDALVEWLVDDLKPDLINLTNLLIAGFVPALRERLDVPVLVTLQGDDIFLDSLPESERTEVLSELRRVARTVDGFVVFSDDYRDRMAALLDVPTDRFHRVRLGLAEPEEFAPREHRPDSPGRTVGYLARICPEKGLHLLVDAFIRLRSQSGFEDVRLTAAGWLGKGDRPFFEAQRRKLTEAGLLEDFQYVAPVDREAKIRFLQGLDLFVVPTIYPEPKGLFALEALAAGVPAVLPAHGCFPELIGEIGGAHLVPPGNVEEFAASMGALLEDEDERRRLGEEGRRGVVEHCNANAAARDTRLVWERFRGNGSDARLQS